MRRQLQRHAAFKPLRRRREHPFVPPRRIGIEIHIVRAAGPRRKVRLQAQPLAARHAEVHPLQPALGHPQAAVVHPLGAEAGAVEADEEVARTHALPPGQASQSHGQGRPHTAGQPRRCAEHRPAGLLRRRARVVRKGRCRPHHGSAVQHIAHHRTYLSVESTQNTHLYFSHNRTVFLRHNIRPFPEKGQNRPTKVPK